MAREQVMTQDLDLCHVALTWMAFCEITLSQTLLEQRVAA
jgi:hypothetical protein